MAQLRAVITTMPSKMPHSLVAGDSRDLLTLNPAKNLVLGRALEVLITVLVCTEVVTELRTFIYLKAYVGGLVR